MKRYLMLLMTFAWLSAIAAEEPGDSVKAGVCMVKASDRLLMVHGFFDHLFSPPGGYLESDEPAEEAAARECLEESGYRVMVEKPLGQLGGAVFFACRTMEPIRVFGSIESNSSPPLMVDSSRAKHLGSETRGTALVKLSDLSVTELRYPNQWEAFVSWMPQIPESQTLESRHILNKPFGYNAWAQVFSPNYNQSCLFPTLSNGINTLNHSSAIGVFAELFILIPIWLFWLPAIISKHRLMRRSETLAVSALITYMVLIAISETLCGIFAWPRPLYLGGELVNEFAKGTNGISTGWLMVGIGIKQLWSDKLMKSVLRFLGVLSSIVALSWLIKGFIDLTTLCVSFGLGLLVPSVMVQKIIMQIDYVCRQKTVWRVFLSLSVLILGVALSALMPLTNHWQWTIVFALALTWFRQSEQTQSTGIPHFAWLQRHALTDTLGLLGLALISHYWVTTPSVWFIGIVKWSLVLALCGVLVGLSNLRLNTRQTGQAISLQK